MNQSKAISRYFIKFRRRVGARSLIQWPQNNRLQNISKVFTFYPNNKITLTTKRPLCPVPFSVASSPTEPHWTFEPNQQTNSTLMPFVANATVDLWPHNSKLGQYGRFGLSYLFYHIHSFCRSCLAHSLTPYNTGWVARNECESSSGRSSSCHCLLVMWMVNG